MAFMINPPKRFRDSAGLTGIPKRAPRNVREAFFISKVHEDGIFQIEGGKGLCTYDRCYVFSDVNYANKNTGEKKEVLDHLMVFLKCMNADFKITIANEYRNMNQFIGEIFSEVNRDRYPDISRGMQELILEKRTAGDVQDLEKVMYLTVTVKAYSHQEAREYFLGMDTQLDNLFSLMRSILVPLSGTERICVLRRFFYRDEDLFPIDWKTPYTDPLDGALPYSIKADETDFMVFNGNRYVSVLFARSFATAINEEELLYRLSRTSYPSFVTVDYAPVEKSVLKGYLRYLHIGAERAISQELDARNRNGQTMAGVSYSREKNMAEIEGVNDLVDDNDDSCLLVGLLVVVTADSEEELSRRIARMKQTGKEVGVMLETYNMVQLKAFHTALPIGLRLVRHERAFLTGSLVCMQPFYAQDLIEPGGQFYGLNTTTKHLVFADRKKLMVPHGMIVGASGSGKSLLIKLLAGQVLLCTGDDITILDPQNEYRSICEAFGGQFIDFTPKCDCHINPMEIPADLLVSRDVGKINRFIADVTKWANAFCQAIMHNIIFTEEHRAAIGKCIRRIYENAFSNRRIRKQPTIRDLREALRNLGEEGTHETDKVLIRRIYNSLSEYTEGAYDMFAHPSNVDMDNRFVAFGLHNVPEDFWEPVMITIMFFLSNRMEYNQKVRRATRFIIDEAQTVANNESSAAIMLNAILTYRKYGGICTMALQNLTRALENAALRDMFANCGFKMFLDQGGVDARSLAEIQELSDKEFHSLSTAVPGRGLMVWGKKVLLVDLRISRENRLYKLFSTNFHEMEEGGDSGRDEGGSGDGNT